ncbi:MAG TPA: hypothetical protein VGN69_07385 [Solirubrobacteraceae bacterium]|jgi:hypothetical protein|nr:hypothetical protein [Solirubrobacteraceae bacterium]
MTLPSPESGLGRRLRWRLRGAWQWPAFVVLVPIDAVLADRLPAAGEGSGLLGGVLLAGFANLTVLAVVAPLGGLLVRRRRRDLPAVVARDYAGTVALLLLAGCMLLLGLAHRPALLAQRQAVRDAADAMRAYVRTQGAEIYRRHLAQADSLRLDDSLFRTCVPGADRMHALCLFVDTSQTPPGVRRDPNPIPNGHYFGRGQSAGGA